MGLFKQLMIFGKTGLQGLPTRMTLFLWAFSRQGATGPGPPIHNMGFCSRLYLKEGTYHTRLFSPPPPNRTCPCRQELDIDDHTDPMCRHSRRGRTGRERPDVEADVDEGGLRLQAVSGYASQSRVISSQSVCVAGFRLPNFWGAREPDLLRLDQLMINVRLATRCSRPSPCLQL